MIRLRTPFLAAAPFTGVAAIGLAPALAQTAPAPANSTAARGEARHHAMERMMPGQFVEGRIAFLKAPDNDARLLAAFKPLYASLSPEQQQMANQLVAAHHHWHHRA